MVVKTRIKNIALGILVVGGTVIGTEPQLQAKDSGKNKTATYPKTADGYTRLPSGLEYKVAREGKGKRHPEVGDHLEMNVRVHVKDSVVFDSRQMNGDKPVPFQVQAPSFRGDFIEGLMLMVAGDSALLRLPVDTILAQNKQLMPGVKPGDVLEYDVTLVSVMSTPEYKKDQAEKNAKQKEIDEGLFKNYFARKNIDALKTANGLFYTINKKGTGENAKPGKIVTVNYTGRFLEGKTFDSNTDPEFRHVEPYQFVLGKGAVIKGWDQGIALLNKGAKATLYIPAGLAYGSQGNSNIPGNTVLVFDVELLDISTEAEAEEKTIQDYLLKKNIKAGKTPSGLYYTIVKEGNGPKPEKGEKVAVNYTGTTMDGHKFDSNIDSAFHHVEPLTFPVGQGAVIKGWDEGISMLKKGSKARLYIPSALAYGEKGQPDAGIRPNSILIFDVELIDDRK